MGHKWGQSNFKNCSDPIYSTRLVRNALLIVLLCLAAAAAAQSFPSKPLHLIVPFPPGGGNDIVARAMALQLGPDLGQPVLVDNRPGARRSLRAELRARRPADGSTLFP